MSQTATVGPAGAVSRVAVEERPKTRARASRKVLRPLLMLGGIAVVIVGSGYYWLTSGRWISIDDSYVRAAKLSLSTDVSGIVQTVAVHDGDRVKEGQVLLSLDPRQFQIALDGARANLAQTGLMMEAMKRDYQRMQRDVDARQAMVQSDEANAQRYNNLVKGGGVTRAETDDAHFKLVADQATLESLKVQAQVQLARLGGNASVDVAKTPQVMEAQARVDEAQRQLDHAVIRSPFNGIVTQVDSVQPGMYLAAATAAFGLVSTDRVWVEGNPKETELTYVKPGDPVDVTVDTYPGRTWKGVVENIAPSSGSEFSILPAQNSSGNWVKVVQRIPVRVHVDRKDGDPELRAGMSVEIDIDTGHVRHLSDLIP